MIMERMKALPLEIREKIFAPCLEWNGKTPNLIIATRPDKQLYQDVIFEGHFPPYQIVQKELVRAKNLTELSFSIDIDNITKSIEFLSGWHRRLSKDHRVRKISFEAYFNKCLEKKGKVFVEDRTDELLIRSIEDALGIEAKILSDQVMRYNDGHFHSLRVWGWDAGSGKVLALVNK